MRLTSQTVYLSSCVYTMKKIFSKLLSTVICLAVLLQPFFVRAAAVKVLLGDADNSGTVEAADARIVLRIAVGLLPLTNTYIAVCDVNGDKKVDAADARFVLRMSVKLENLNGKTVEINNTIPLDSDKSLAVIADIALKVPAAPKVNAVPGTFTFTVYGNGHGVGLSQVGACRMADMGYDYAQILSYYYSDSELVYDDFLPEKCTYNGTEYNTIELVARVTACEIGNVNPEAIKAQAVAVYTLLRRCDFNDTTGACGALYNNGTWNSVFSETVLLPAVKSVLGQYVTRKNDYSGEPVLTVYSAMAAGRTVGCNEIWYASYPVSVYSPFEATATDFVHNSGPYTADEIKKRILAYDSSIVLPNNPAKWFDILEHNASLSSEIGYVTQLLVGDTVLSGVGAIDKIIDLSSGCYTITYTPVADGS